MYNIKNAYEVILMFRKSTKLYTNSSNQPPAPPQAPHGLVVSAEAFRRRAEAPREAPSSGDAKPRPGGSVNGCSVRSKSPPEGVCFGQFFFGR